LWKEELEEVMSEKEDEIAEEEFPDWLRKYGRRRESEGYSARVYGNRTRQGGTC
jgi:hypothetical protein